MSKLGAVLSPRAAPFKKPQLSHSCFDFMVIHQNTLSVGKNTGCIGTLYVLYIL